MAKRIAIAGATGNLGNRIVKALVMQGADVLALVRKESGEEKIKALKTVGVEVAQVDLSNIEELSQPLQGTSCVVSAVQGLREVIVDAQTVLLEAAIKAGVPRFIPSDFSTDFRRRPAGEIAISICVEIFTRPSTKLPLRRLPSSTVLSRTF